MEANIELTAIDFETTGSVPGYQNQPWQIGLVSLTSTELYNQFDSLLYIGERPFNKYAPGRHAQLREELKQSPKLVELWPELFPRLVGRVLVAHNIGTERTMLKQVAPMHRFDCWIDTLALSRRVWKGLSSYALEDLIVVLQLKDKIDDALINRIYYRDGQYWIKDLTYEYKDVPDTDQKIENMK